MTRLDREERLALAEHISWRLWYPYSCAGYVKASPFEDFRFLDEVKNHWIADFTDDLRPLSDEAIQKMIRLYFEDQFTDYIPEHVMYGELLGSDWKRCNIKEAEKLVDVIVAWSAEEDKHREAFDYTDVRKWFFQLFHPDQVVYLSNSPSLDLAEIKKWKRIPGVVGIDRTLIGVFFFNY